MAEKGKKEWREKEKAGARLKRGARRGRKVVRQKL